MRCLPSKYDFADLYKALRPVLTGREGVVSGDVYEMAGVVKREHPDISAPAYFEAVDAAIGCDDPGGLTGVAADGSH